jgi:hypothetical protein
MHTPPRPTVRPSQVLRELQALRTELTLSQQSGHVHAVSLEALAAARQRHGGNTEEAAAAAAAAAPPPPPPPQQSAATAAAAAAAASEEAHYLGLLDAIGLGTEPASAVLPPPLPLEAEAHAPAATVSSMAGAPAADSQSLIVNLGDTPCPPPTPVEPWRTSKRLRHAPVFIVHARHPRECDDDCRYRAWRAQPERRTMAPPAVERPPARWRHAWSRCLPDGRPPRPPPRSR